MKFDHPPVVRVDRAPGGLADLEAWPASIPAVGQVLRDGLDLGPGVTFVVGENGSGRSPLVEAIALAFGMSPEGGSAHGRHQTRSSESSLHGDLRLKRCLGASRWGFFLRHTLAPD